MSKQAEQKLEEWAVWWDERKRELSDPMKKQVVMLKMIEGFFDILAYMARDIRDAEGRPQVQSNLLWLPHGMTRFKDEGRPNPDDSELGIRG